MNIQSILTTKGTDVVTVGPDKTIRDALATLAKHNFGALVVVNEANMPIGILSERRPALSPCRKASSDQPSGRDERCPGG